MTGQPCGAAPFHAAAAAPHPEAEYYDKIIRALGNRATRDAHARHVAAIERLLALSKDGLLLRDLAHVGAILRLCADRAAEPAVAPVYEPLALGLVKAASRPFVRAHAADDVRCQPQAIELCRALAHCLGSPRESVANAAAAALLFIAESAEPQSPGGGGVDALGMGYAQRRNLGYLLAAGVCRTAAELGARMDGLGTAARPTTSEAEAGAPGKPMAEAPRGPPARALLVHGLAFAGVPNAPNVRALSVRLVVPSTGAFTAATFLPPPEHSAGAEAGGEGGELLSAGWPDEWLELPLPASPPPDSTGSGKVDWVRVEVLGNAADDFEANAASAAGGGGELQVMKVLAVASVSLRGGSGVVEVTLGAPGQPGEQESGEQESGSQEQESWEKVSGALRLEWEVTGDEEEEGEGTLSADARLPLALLQLLSACSRVEAGARQLLEPRAGPGMRRLLRQLNAPPPNRFGRAAAAPRPGALERTGPGAAYVCDLLWRLLEWDEPKTIRLLLSARGAGAKEIATALRRTCLTGQSEEERETRNELLSLSLKLLGAPAARAPSSASSSAKSSLKSAASAVDAANAWTEATQMRDALLSCGLFHTAAMLLGASATATMAALLLPALAAFAPAAASSTTPAAAVKMREQMSARAFNSLACAANLEATLAAVFVTQRAAELAWPLDGAAAAALRASLFGNNPTAPGAIADAREIAARGGGGGGGLLETLLLLAAPPSAAVLAAQLSETFGAGTLGGRGFSAGGTVGGRTVGGGLGGNLASLGPAQAQSAFARYGVAHGREVQAAALRALAALAPIAPDAFVAAGGPAVVAAALRESLGVAPPTDFESVSFASVHQEGRARLGGDGKVPRLAGAAAVPHPQGEGSLLLNPSNGFANGSHGEPSSRSSPSPSLNSSAASAAGASARWGGSNQGQQAMLRAMGSQMPSMGASLRGADFSLQHGGTPRVLLPIASTISSTGGMGGGALVSLLPNHSSNSAEIDDARRSVRDTAFAALAATAALACAPPSSAESLASESAVQPFSGRADGQRALRRAIATGAGEEISAAYALERVVPLLMAMAEAAEARARALGGGSGGNGGGFGAGGGMGVSALTSASWLGGAGALTQGGGALAAARPLLWGGMRESKVGAEAATSVVSALCAPPLPLAPSSLGEGGISIGQKGIGSDAEPLSGGTVDSPSELAEHPSLLHLHDFLGAHGVAWLSSALPTSADAPLEPLLGALELAWATLMPPPSLPAHSTASAEVRSAARADFASKCDGAWRLARGIDCVPACALHLLLALATELATVDSQIGAELAAAEVRGRSIFQLLARLWREEEGRQGVLRVGGGALVADPARPLEGDLRVLPALRKDNSGLQQGEGGEGDSEGEEPVAHVSLLGGAGVLDGFRVGAGAEEREQAAVAAFLKGESAAALQIRGLGKAPRTEQASHALAQVAATVDNRIGIHALAVAIRSAIGADGSTLSDLAGSRATAEEQAVLLALEAYAHSAELREWSNIGPTLEAAGIRPTSPDALRLAAHMTEGQAKALALGHKQALLLEAGRGESEAQAAGQTRFISHPDEGKDAKPPRAKTFTETLRARAKAESMLLTSFEGYGGSLASLNYTIGISVGQWGSGADLPRKEAGSDGDSLSDDEGEERLRFVEPPDVQVEAGEAVVEGSVDFLRSAPARHFPAQSPPSRPHRRSAEPSSVRESGESRQGAPGKSPSGFSSASGATLPPSGLRSPTGALQVPNARSLRTSQ